MGTPMRKTMAFRFRIRQGYLGTLGYTSRDSRRCRNLICTSKEFQRSRPVSPGLLGSLVGQQTRADIIIGIVRITTETRIMAIYWAIRLEEWVGTSRGG